MFGQEEVRYIENLGQWNEKVLYKAKLENGEAFLKQNLVRFNFYDSDKIDELHKENFLNSNLNIDQYSYDLIFSKLK